MVVESLLDGLSTGILMSCLSEHPMLPGANNQIFSVLFAYEHDRIIRVHLMLGASGQSTALISLKGERNTSQLVSWLSLHCDSLGVVVKFKSSILISNKTVSRARL